MELADHKNVTTQTGMDVYFADPRSPWQRGTNENTNRLLRQYLPKGVSMGGLSQADLDTIAARLNNRPRRVLGYDTPAERLTTILAGDPRPKVSPGRLRAAARMAAWPICAGETRNRHRACPRSSSSLAWPTS